VNASARILAAVLVSLTACSSDAPGHPVEDPVLEQTARDVVAMLGGSNCHLLPGHLAAAGESFLRSSVTPQLMDTMTDPMERVCFVLGVVQDYPRSETMEVRAESMAGGRADLILTGNGRRAELRLVRQGGEWKLDHEWALKQVQDLVVHQSLRLFALNQESFYYAAGRRFTTNPGEVTEATDIVASFTQGVATPEVAPMAVFAALGPDAQSVCGSSLSLSGELFMVRTARDGSATYARGSTLPASCPGTPLQASW
jgi:hypothetical protein